MVTDGSTLHKCLVADQLDLRIESFGPGIITITDRGKTDLRGIEIPKGSRPDTFGHFQLKGLIRIFDDFHGQ